MRLTLPRLFGSAQDAVTVTTYLVAWVSPDLLSLGQFRGLLAAVAVEFFVMHASGLYGFGAAKRGVSASKRAWILGILTAVYLIPVVGMTIELKTAAPVISFLWLFTSRFLFILRHPESAAVQSALCIKLWGVSLASFGIGLVLVNVMPLPALGLTPQFVASLSLSGHPNPSAEPPQKTIAFGLFYFFVQTCAKFYLSGDPGAGLSKQVRRSVE